MFRYKKITPERLLQVLSLPGYNLAKELGVRAESISKLTRSIWPEKPRSNIKLCTYLLLKYEYKYCNCCGFVYELDNFYKNLSDPTGYGTYCRSCQASKEKPYAASKTAAYEAAKANRIPNWQSLEEKQAIANFYKNCPDGYEVDHIIPLRGILVSGLHTISNLQYLLKSENGSKSNKFTPC